MTEEQIIGKLTSLCAKSEHCKHEMRVKMERWEVPHDIQERILNFLVEERYIDEERYARYFINDKMKYNKWGRKKVEQALYMKRIPRDIYAPIFEEIDEEDYKEILLPLLKTKSKSVKGNSDYEIRCKLIRFAIQRGFTYEQAISCMKKIND